jgi:hypothetical protein
MTDFIDRAIMRVAHWFDWFEREEKPGGTAAFEGIEVVPGLWLSGFIESWPTAQGITAVLNVAEEDRDPEPPEGCAAYWIPWLDLPPAPTPERLHDAVLLVADWCRRGYGVLVHCDAGHNRSALVVCAYLAYSQRMPPSDARALVSGKRNAPCLHDWQYGALVAYTDWLT